MVPPPGGQSLSLVKHSAPGQAAGYGLQFDMALHFLSLGTADAVGIETLDDVVMSSAHEQVLGQLKSSVASKNPFSDGSVGLWKALCIWADALESGEVGKGRTSFQLLFSGELQPGLAVELGQANTPDEINHSIRRLRTEPREPSSAAKPYVECVRRHDDKVLGALIPALTVIGECRTADLHKQIVARLLLPIDVSPDNVVEDLVGWIKVLTQRAWEERQPAWIRQAAFNERRHSAIEKHRRRRVRELPARELLCDAADVRRHRSDCFVRQLDIIDADAGMVEDAILDFIRHNKERLRLTKEGDTEESDWTEFDDRLVEHWKPIFRRSCQEGGKPRLVGQRTYAAIQHHREILNGIATTEMYLTRGAFHRLADVIRLGWHPRFEPLCRSHVATS
jgi:C-terminal domain 7 of the ABC-three component (ABC-3C) systems